MEYRVICLAISGKGNKMYKSGEVVNSSRLLEGSIESLINLGKIEKANKVKIEKVEKIVEIEKIETVEKELIPYKEITAKELKKLLEMEDSNLSKKELYALYEKLD